VKINDDISIEVYSSGITRITPENSLVNAEGLTFETIYPGGWYGSGSLFVPRHILRWWPIDTNQRIVFSNGHRTVYEGWIDGIEDQADANNMGVTLDCVGAWGKFAMRRGLHRLYIDRRVDTATWRYEQAPGSESKGDIRRSNDLGDVLMFTPRNVAWGNNEYISLDYYAPTGEKVKKLIFDYDLTSNGEDFSIELYNEETAASLWSRSITAAGSTTGSEETVILSPTSNHLSWRFISDAAQTPAGLGATYAEISDLRVYAETNNSGNIADSMNEIVLDLISEFSDFINADTGNVGVAGSPYTIDNYIAQGDYIADILTAVTGFGDAAFNAWAAQFVNSQLASTEDGKPPLWLAQYPALTGYDFKLNMDDLEIAGIQIQKNIASVRNWIRVRYLDDQNNEIWITPDDDANLKDTASIADNGQQEENLFFNNMTTTGATNLARRFLAQMKDPKYILTAPLPILHTIKTGKNDIMPVSWVRAGLRIGIMDYLGGVNFLISHTRYNHDERTCYVTAGQPDPFAIALAQPLVLRTVPTPPPPRPKRKRR
jgi:hypothetical protein